MPSPFNAEPVLVCLDQIEVACLRPCPTYGFHGVHPELPRVEYGDGFDLRSSTVGITHTVELQFSRNEHAQKLHILTCGAERACSMCPTYTQKPVF